MVTVAELGFAPGKSMHAYDDVQALEFGTEGLLVGDRQYMWVEVGLYTYVDYKAGRQVEPGTFLSQREDPTLTGVMPTLVEGGVELTFHKQDGLFVPSVEDNADSRIPVSVWGWSGEAVDQGDEAAEWGSEYVGRPVRLVAVSNEKPRYVEDDPALGRVGFADGFTVTVGSTTALEAINTYLESQGKNPMPTDRARATIILDGLEVPGEDFPEDYVRTISVVRNGLTLVLERWKACSRCPIPDTDQTTGERSRDTRVRPALGKLGRAGKHVNTEKYGDESGLFLTQNHVVRVPEDMPNDAVIELRKGDEVMVEYSEDTNWVRQAA